VQKKTDIEKKKMKVIQTECTHENPFFRLNKLVIDGEKVFLRKISVQTNQIVIEGVINLDISKAISIENALMTQHFYASLQLTDENLNTVQQLREQKKLWI
jgi:hypothetical protein